MNAKTALAKKIVSGAGLTQQISDWKTQGKKIVFTNGCFDLVHAGHIAYLTEASALGDVLIIGLNSDQSTQRIKGPERPINNEITRSTLLSSMFFVDAVALFNEDTPLELIKNIQPDILVKGGDYQAENIIGAKEVIANGGKVEILSFLPGYSSTSIIEKIKTFNSNC